MKHLDYNELKYGVTILDDDYVVYKKLFDAIAQLVLVKGTKVMKSRNHIQKLRANEAHTLLIIPYYWRKYHNLDNKESSNMAIGMAHFTTYSMGKDIKPNGFNTNISDNCGKGIHFFCTLKQAEKY